MTPEAFARLVRSNYILAEFRNKLPGSFPRFVKWGLAHAFNGAVLCNDDTILELLFHSPGRSVADEFVTQLPTMIVSGGVNKDSERPISADDFQRIVRDADARFDKLYSGAVPNDIRFVQGIFQHGTPFGPGLDTFIDALGNAFANPLSGTYTVGSVLDASVLQTIGSVPNTPAQPTPLIETELCVELPAAMDEATVVDRLRTSFPEVQSPLIGSGGTMGSIDSTDIPSIRWGNIIARHF